MWKGVEGLFLAVLRRRMVGYSDDDIVNSSRLMIILYNPLRGVVLKMHSNKL